MNLNKIPAGKNPPSEIYVFIEISEGSTVKYEYDETLEIMKADRFIHGALYFPFNYGFIPQSRGEDSDPLDVVVISSCTLTPATLISCRTIGLLKMTDEEGIDTKIITLPEVKIDPIYAEIDDIKQLPSMIKKRIKNFFDRYKDLEEGKWVKTNKFLGKDFAFEIIDKSIKK